MNKININLEHCFDITKLSQSLDFASENVALIYAPNGLMKTFFAKTLKLYGQEKTDEVKDVVADIAGIEINREVLADLAMNHPEAFKVIVNKVK